MTLDDLLAWKVAHIMHDGEAPEVRILAMEDYRSLLADPATMPYLEYSSMGQVTICGIRILPELDGRAILRGETYDP